MGHPRGDGWGALFWEGCRDTWNRQVHQRGRSMERCRYLSMTWNFVINGAIDPDKYKGKRPERLERWWSTTWPHPVQPFREKKGAEVEEAAWKIGEGIWPIFHFRIEIDADGLGSAWSIKTGGRMRIGHELTKDEGVLGRCLQRSTCRRGNEIVLTAWFVSCRGVSSSA